MTSGMVNMCVYVVEYLHLKYSKGLIQKGLSDRILEQKR